MFTIGFAFKVKKLMIFIYPYESNMKVWTSEGLFELTRRPLHGPQPRLVNCSRTYRDTRTLTYHVSDNNWEEVSIDVYNSFNHDKILLPLQKTYGRQTWTLWFPTVTGWLFWTSWLGEAPIMPPAQGWQPRLHFSIRQTRSENIWNQTWTALGDHAPQV